MGELAIAWTLFLSCGSTIENIAIKETQFQDCKNMGAKNVLVVTDSRLAKMKPVKTVCEALEQQNVPYKLYDQTKVEPTDER